MEEVSHPPTHTFILLSLKTSIVSFLFLPPSHPLTTLTLSTPATHLQLSLLPFVWQLFPRKVTEKFNTVSHRPEPSCILWGAAPRCKVDFLERGTLLSFSSLSHSFFFSFTHKPTYLYPHHLCFLLSSLANLPVLPLSSVFLPSVPLGKDFSSPWEKSGHDMVTVSACAQLCATD